MYAHVTVVTPASWTDFAAVRVELRKCIVRTLQTALPNDIVFAEDGDDGFWVGLRDQGADGAASGHWRQDAVTAIREGARAAVGQPAVWLAHVGPCRDLPPISEH